MKTPKFEFSKILASHKSLSSYAANVARLEAEIVISERHFEEVETDDGTTDPETIYTRCEAARRDLGIRRIEANRAAAKLAEAEEELGNLVMRDARVIADHLDEVSRAEAERVKKQAVSLFGENAIETTELKFLISGVPAVHGPATAAHRIRLGLQFGGRRPGQDLIANVLSAESFL